MTSDKESLKKAYKKIINKTPYFIHIPKSGGSFTKITIRNHGVPIGRYPFAMGHCTVNSKASAKFIKLNNYKEWNEKNHFFFSTVRNPFELLISWYFSGTHGWGNTAKLIEASNIDDYIRIYCENNFCFKDFNQCLYGQLFDETGKYVPAITIRTEFLNAGLSILLRKCGLVSEIENLKFPKPNSSPRRKEKDYRKYYNDKTREMVEKKCKFELEAFGYTFDGPVDNSPIIVPAEGREIIKNFV